MRRSLPLLRQMAICLALAGLACWLTILVWPMSERFPFAFFLAAVVASAWCCGPAASIFTTTLCTGALGYIYYWQSPTNGFELVQENLPRLALFLFTGLLTSYLVRECRGAIMAVDRVHVMLGHLGEALITTDPQGMVRFVNEQAQTLTGCDAREAIGKPLGHILTLLDERTRQPLPQPNQAVMARRVAVDLPANALLQSARGKGVAVEGRAAPIQDGDRIDGVAITFRDVTRRRTEEQANLQRLEVWQKAAAAVPDPIFVKDELGNYVGANAAGAHLVARDLNAIAGAEDAALFSPEVARTIVQADRLAFETGQPQSYQLAVGDGDERRIFDAVKTPVRGPDGKLGGLVDVLHEVKSTPQGEEKHKQALRDLERRLEEQALAHKTSEDRLRQSHEKQCAALHTARQNSEDSWNEQLAELRRRLDEKTIEHAEAQTLLSQLPQEQDEDFEERVAGERASAERAYEAKLETTRAEHAKHLQAAVAAEQQRGDELVELAQQEHAQTLAEYQSAWETSEAALQQAKNELEELRGRSTQPEASVAARQEREELIQRLAEQTAAKLGLEESLRRAHEKLQGLKERIAQPRDLNQHQVEEIRRQAAAELERKWNEDRAALQQRLDLTAQEHEKQIRSAQDAWQRTQADYERQLAEARSRHEELQGETARLAQPRELDPQQVEEVRRLAATEHERKWSEDRTAWQNRLDLANQEHDQRFRSAQESWRQTLADYDRRLAEARNQVGETEGLRDQLEQSRIAASQARREKEELEGLLKSRSLVTANGKSPVSRAAYEAWQGAAEPTNPDWLSFN